MKRAHSLALGFTLCVFAPPAFAQMAGGLGSGMSMGGAGGAPAPKMEPRAPQIAPSGLPGVGNMAPPSTGPQLKAPIGGDPTQELFTAISKNDYGSAQDAISRGAQLSAKNQFGETPIDMSIALNRNAITFMLLGSRNEIAAQGGGGTMGKPWTLNNAPAAPAKGSKQAKSHKQAPMQPAKASPAPHYGNAGTGTPDPQAGFLGFGPKG
ncbi:ankyrin repeat domain-containing protein [Acidocella facilis]|uniref:ankyrin repeat domain-containing protein n=1 Tax=Acidocella facilis TaxID=525 RepID=UPI0012DFE875|nr:ankyrin repeat domain-containing protein [Acidocella facilis]